MGSAQLPGCCLRFQYVVAKQETNLGPRVAVGVIAVITAVGCSLDWEPPPKPVSNWTVGNANQFSEFPLYWLGQSYEGLPLTYVGGSTDGDGVHHATSWYGQPTYAGDAASGSWVPPLEVGMQPYCGFSPEELHSYE